MTVKNFLTNFRMTLRATRFVRYLIVLSVYAGISESQGNNYCNPSNCQLPYCYCKGSDIPNNLHRDSTPQLVMITFDDAVTRNSYDLYKQLISGIANPNGCPISGTFFVSHEYTDYWSIQQLHAQGHEIASHSISHRYPSTWWKTANYTDWYSEIQGQREMLSTWANIDKAEIRGMRAPFLQVGGNWQFQVIADMKQDGFQYDSSLISYIHKFDPYPDPIWPYTLDYPTTDDCGIDPCPDWTFRGVWEVPLVEYEDRDGSLCSMLDDCDSSVTEDDLYQTILRNFENHYNTNRAPFGLFMHAPWLKKSSNYNAVKRFLRDVSSRRNVWFVSASQVLDWMKQPTEIQRMDSFEPFNCWSRPNFWACSDDRSVTCVYDPTGQLVWPHRISKRHAIASASETSNLDWERHYKRPRQPTFSRRPSSPSYQPPTQRNFLPVRPSPRPEIFEKPILSNYPKKIYTENKSNIFRNNNNGNNNYGGSDWFRERFNRRNFRQPKFRQPNFRQPNFRQPNFRVNFPSGRRRGFPPLHSSSRRSDDSGSVESETSGGRITHDAIRSGLGQDGFNGANTDRWKRQSGTYHTLHICAEFCPYHYPWVNNVDGL